MKNQNTIAIFLLIFLTASLSACRAPSPTQGPAPTASPIPATTATVIEAPLPSPQAPRPTAEATTTLPPAPTAQVVQVEQVPPTPPPAIGANDSGTSGELVLLFSTDGNVAPQSASSVMIFSADGLVDQGESAAGVYRTTLPEGLYDLVILQKSLPPAGYLQKDVSILPGETLTLALAAALEGSLEVTLHSKSGNPPQKPYQVIVRAGDEDVTSVNRTAGTALSTVLLRTDVLYDLTILYAAAEITATNVSVSGDGSPLELLLPYDEGNLDVFVTQDGAALPANAIVSVVDPDGKQVATSSAVKDRFTTALPAGVEYTIIVQFAAQVLEDTITIEAAGLHTLSFDFPTP